MKWIEEGILKREAEKSSHSMLGMEPRASSMLGEFSKTDSHTAPWICETGSPCVVQAGLKSLPSSCLSPSSLRIQCPCHTHAVCFPQGKGGCLSSSCVCLHLGKHGRLQPFLKLVPRETPCVVGLSAKHRKLQAPGRSWSWLCSLHVPVAWWSPLNHRV